jgi:hypothetical protein
MAYRKSRSLRFPQALAIHPIEDPNPPESYSGVSLDPSTSSISIDMGVPVQAPPQELTHPVARIADYFNSLSTTPQPETTTAPPEPSGPCTKKDPSGCAWMMQQAQAQVVNTPPPVISPTVLTPTSPSQPLAAAAVSPVAVFKTDAIQPVVAAVSPPAGGITSTKLEESSGLVNIAFNPPSVSYSNAFSSYTPPEFSITPCSSSNNYAEGGCEPGSDKFRVNMNTAVTSLR